MSGLQQEVLAAGVTFIALYAAAKIVGAVERRVGMRRAARRIAEAARRAPGEGVAWRTIPGRR